MKTYLRIATLVVAAFCTFAVALAQQMPQDNWRSDGLQFASPTQNSLRSIAIGGGGVYIGEESSGLMKILQFTEGGVFVRRFADDFSTILGMACDLAGNVYVLDRGSSTVKVFDQNGTFLRSWGEAGSGNGQFSIGSAGGFAMIAVDKNSRVYVCDPGNSRVQVFDSAGTFLRKWGQPGSLPDQFEGNDPVAIAWSPKGEVYVGTYGAPNFRVFGEDGTYRRSGSPFYGGNPFAISPDGLLVGGYSNYYSQQFQVADVNLNVVVSYGFNFRGDGGFAINKRGDIYLIGSNAKTVYVYQREYSGVQNSLLAPAIPQPIVLSAAQRTGTSWMDIDYQVTDADSATVTTGALAFKNGGNTLNDVVVMSTFTENTAANLGANQPTGVPRHLTWNMAADWSVDFSQVQIEALAKDSRNLLGVHWITVPASGPNPAFQVSSAPISDAQFLDLWFWFLGSHHAGVRLNSGAVYGTGGLFTNASLAGNISTSAAGRLFAYGQLGVRPVNSGEIARAQGGNYGISSVDQNSVVKEATSTTSYLEGWGDNSYGKAANSPLSAGAVKVAAGSQHSFFLKADGTLWGVGQNNYGQLGDGSNTDRSVPVQVATGVTQVAAGSEHSLFIKGDGTLWAMGRNDYGQLGDGANSHRATPVQVAAQVTQIATGGYHSLFVKTDGTLWAMGSNGYTQLGDGTSTNRNTPVQVATGVSKVAAGDIHSLFIKTSDASLWGMGYNGEGALGDGTGTSHEIPIQIDTGIVDLAGGARHTLYLKTGGILWGTGSNTQGQLGDGSNTTRYSPVQIATDVSRLVPEPMADHSLFIKTDKTLWGMGRNSEYQVGDGTNVNRNLPVQIRYNVTAAAAGAYYSLAVITAP